VQCTGQAVNRSGTSSFYVAQLLELATSHELAAKCVVGLENFATNQMEEIDVEHLPGNELQKDEVCF
jgi:hypothetical protein